MKGLSAIVPQHAPLLPPLGAVPEGQTAEGLPLYRLIQTRSKSVPDLDENGEQRWRVHPQNGVPLIPIRKRVNYVHNQLFYLESDGAFNINHVPYAHPTPEEIAAEKRAKKIATMQDGLAEALVDAGMTPAELVALAAKGPAEPEGDELLEALKVEADGKLTEGPSEPEAPSY